MLARRTLAAAFLLLAPASLAQTSLRSHLRPITSEVKDAGVLDLATGTWTRRASGIGLTTGPEIVYSNTCSTGYYAGWTQGWTIQDEGAIPNSLLPSVPSGSVAGGYDQNPGCADRYEVNGFEIGYCTYQPTFTTSIRFYDQYETMGSYCAVPGVPIADYALSGLPGSSSAGVSTCWTVTIDLATTPAGALVDPQGTVSTPLHGASVPAGSTTYSGNFEAALIRLTLP